ncbi:MAG: SDR family NAD(P)-dependent oxidoreductase, partial [SAR202 cluster bacterium]|nr:SDR family NAD(P)-dependent oxidoreductase [SAR202 cluster bacterium]
MRLENKVAIITGGANGMGAEEARMFAREGAKVVVADRQDEDGESVVSQIAEAGGTGVYVNADVTSESDWQRLVDQTVSQFGRL